MTNSYLTFEAIMEDTKNSSSLYYYLKNYVRPPYDCSDILRWQWAQSVSALDKLIHDLVRVGMLEIFQGNRAITTPYQNIIHLTALTMCMCLKNFQTKQSIYLIYA